MLPAVLALFLIFPGVPRAAELLMFEEPGCPWCAAWRAEIGIVYDKTAEGRRAPLRRVDMTAPRPRDLEAVDAVVFSPTFVLFAEGAEVGRIVGYPGEDFFWPMLSDLLARLGRSPEG
ncbi:MAG: hypothetical protein QNJ30_20115 [Kiloniellales bacterium]|nr:hypothetical protein [Kiloniellales bacterium]